MYAVVQSGGRQHKVQVGQTLDVDLLPATTGETIELGRVLAIGGVGEPRLGQPTVPGARVLAEVVGRVRAPKVIVFKYKNKVRYRRKIGHRQPYTRVLIRTIESGPAALAEE